MGLPQRVTHLSDATVRISYEVTSITDRFSNALVMGILSPKLPWVAILGVTYVRHHDICIYLAILMNSDHKPKTKSVWIFGSS